jgi:competence protein ComEA
MAFQNKTSCTFIIRSISAAEYCWVSSTTRHHPPGALRRLRNSHRMIESDDMKRFKNPKLSEIGKVAFACLLWISAASTAWAQMPDGPGKDVAVKVCGYCHDVEVVKQYHMRKDGWTETISKMIEQGAQGTDEEFNTVLDYLVKNFGPSPAPVNVNKATASELETQLEITTKEAASIVKYRGDKGSFKQIDDLKNVPDLDFRKIESKKDRLVFGPQ